MREAIYAALKPVRARQQKLVTLRCVVVGLIAGAVAGLAVGLARQAFALEISWAFGAAAVAAGPVLGLLVGLCLRRNWHDAAVAVDAHYRLKDRAVTALAFASQTAPTELHAIQISDALGHLSAAQPKEVVPMKAPRAWPIALVVTASAAALLAWPLTQREAAAAPAPVPEHIAAVAADQKVKLTTLDKNLSETTQDLEDEKADDNKKGIKELLEKLAQKIEEINQPGRTRKSACQAVGDASRMQALANQLNVAAMDGQLSSLGSALAASTAFEGAGKALRMGSWRRPPRN